MLLVNALFTLYTVVCVCTHVCMCMCMYSTAFIITYGEYDAWYLITKKLTSIQLFTSLCMRCSVEFFNVQFYYNVYT